jgi:hypothetical protein
VAKVAVSRLFDKLELPNELRLEPPTSHHLCCGETGAVLMACRRRNYRDAMHEELRDRHVDQKGHGFGTIGETWWPFVFLRFFLAVRTMYSQPSRAANWIR